MKKMLIISTIKDLSIPLFLTQKIQKKINVDFCFFHESTDEIKKKLVANNYNYIYIRDPFNYVYDKGNIEEKFNVILNNRKKSYLVDNLKILDDIYFEDKWKQYQLFEEFMPKTKLLTNTKDVDNSRLITKQRISSRAKGIVFNSKDMVSDNLSDYIIQKKIKIDEEYRVYVIFNKIIKEASLKSPKTQHSKVKVIGYKKISTKITNFVNNIIKQNKFDFIGLDIAKSKNNLYLLEVNRSCLFNGYFSNNQINLAETFIDKLLKKN